MIRGVLGGIGSGKTLYTVKKIITTPHQVYGNMTLTAPNYHRIRTSEVLQYDQDEKGKISVAPNWEYWKAQIKKHKGFHIYLDEVHNLMNARRSMSKQNVALMAWVSQIRKVTGDSEIHDLIVISQELERMDITIRDLLNEIIYCEKITLPQHTPTLAYKRGKIQLLDLPKTYIMQTVFTGTRCVPQYWSWRLGGARTYTSRRAFYANPMFKYYNSYEIVEFGESEYI